MRLEDIDKIAKDAGFTLRPPQRQAMELLTQGHDLLLVWPTGSGKSLCYQLPGVAGQGLTVVVSPLIALMDDQVAKLKALGWPAVCVHSAVRRNERLMRLAKVERKEVKLLYVTPERFRDENFRKLLSEQEVSLLAIDEAHCISQWGHDFRPDYSRLAEIRGILGNPQTIAMTATATKEVQADILRQLRLQHEPVVLWEGVERPNLHLAAVEADGFEEKVEGVMEWLAEVTGPKIIYCTLIGSLQKLSEQLQVKGIRHDLYHGDLDSGKRKASQKAFLDGSSQLMLATPAFGLGVDKPDVRGVAHFEVPGSLEAYFQEVGRAGRDGQPAHCRLFYHQDDLEVQLGFIETLTPDPGFVRATYKLLVSWQDRLKGLQLDDLREQLSFKNKRDYRLETALSFLDRWEVISFPHRRLDRLEFLRELQEEDLSEELWKARKLQLQKKLMSVVQWFRTDRCRKVGIYDYFGWPDTKPCGFCDRCDEGLG